MFQKITQIVRNKSFFNYFKWKRMALSCSKKLSALIGGITSKHQCHFYCFNCLHFFATENEHESTDVKIKVSVTF